MAATTPTTLLSEVELSLEDEENEYDTLIQGSDRAYPAIVLRRKSRGVGATIKTISKFGKYSELYKDYQEVIDAYLARKRKRQEQGSRIAHEGLIVATKEGWLGEVASSVVGGRTGEGNEGGL